MSTPNHPPAPTPYDVRVVRSGFPLRLDIDGGLSAPDGGLLAALVVLPFGWVACRLVNIIRFKRSWTVGVVTQAKWWGGSKIALRERFPTKAAAEVRARELEARIEDATVVLPTKSSLTAKRPHGTPDPGR
ncbi:hypothetical protein [Modestobacter italicus]|nr:hypothetical protein [Modestobacter marinus]